LLDFGGLGLFVDDGGGGGGASFGEAAPFVASFVVAAGDDVGCAVLGGGCGGLVLVRVESSGRCATPGDASLLLEQPMVDLMEAFAPLSILSQVVKQASKQAQLAR
jgi:hypothetical protein